MAKLTFQTDLCKGCGLCVDACPKGCLAIADNKINLTAQDIDFSVSANETLACSYEGQPMSIGFKSTFLVEILSNIETPTVVIELADATRAGVFKPVYDDKQSSATLMLLMPMMINA